MSTPLRRCWDLSETHLKEAMSSRQAMGSLLKEMAAVAKPDSGATKILLAIARLAKPACDWIDGAVRVEIEDAGGKTRFTIMEDLGGGMRELVFPRLLVDAPLAEFDRSLRLAARAIAPLSLSAESDQKLVLTNKKVRTSHEPPSFELAEDCLRRSLPPAVRKSVAPAAAPPAPATGEPVLERRARGSKPPAPAPPAAAPNERVIEMPRTAKVLDFGDFDEATAKRPSRRPPRP